MYEILDHLPAEARVLDLGSNTGSFPAEAYGFATVRVDSVALSRDTNDLEQADAASLPFPSRTFNASF